METGDCYISAEPLWEGDIELLVDSRFVSDVGTIDYMYSDNDHCMCCPGRHVYGHRLKNADDAVISLSDWMHRQIRTLPDGTKVRLRIDVIE